MRAAPWSTAVKGASAFTAIVLVALAVGLPYALSGASHPPFADGMRGLLRLLPIAILAVAALFVVRGYDIAGRDLLVERLLWATRVPIDGLEAAWADPDAMNSSLRVFGNGGLFAVTGVYRNRKLGTYRAFVTDRRRSVVLRIRAGKSIVVSPERPETFLATLKARFPGLAEGPPR
jgi:hypothetical protein